MELAVSVPNPNNAGGGEKPPRKPGSGLNPNSHRNFPRPSTTWGVAKRRRNLLLTDEAIARLNDWADLLGISPGDIIECFIRSPQVTEDWLLELKKIHPHPQDGTNAGVPEFSEDEGEPL